MKTTDEDVSARFRAAAEQATAAIPFDADRILDGVQRRHRRRRDSLFSHRSTTSVAAAVPPRHAGRRLVVAVGLAAAVASVAVLGPGVLDDAGSPPTSGAGPQVGLASGAGVLGCANRVLWGTVTATESTAEGLLVTLDVEEWVIPSEGERQVSILADDPAREVGAPSWPTAQRLLVVVPPAGPTEYAVGADARQLLRDWRGAGSPRLTPEDCRQS